VPERFGTRITRKRELVYKRIAAGATFLRDLAYTAWVESAKPFHRWSLSINRTILEIRITLQRLVRRQPGAIVEVRRSPAAQPLRLNARDSRAISAPSAQASAKKHARSRQTRL